MTEGVGAGSGGGIHPGAPTIWPTVQSKQVKEAQQSQQSGQATTVPAQSAKETSVTEQIAQQAQQSASPSKPTVARSLSKADISAQLVSMGIPSSSDNVQLASKMLMHGLELSQDNFSNLFKMMKNGSGSGTQQSALIALSKGLSSEAAVKTLDGFMANNPKMTSEMQLFQTAMNNFKTALLTGKNMMQPQIINNLLSILSKMDDKYKKMLEGNMSKEDMLQLMDRDGMMKELRAFKGLLAGVSHKMMQGNAKMSKSAKQLGKAFSGMARYTDKLLMNLGAHSILSRPSGKQDVALNEKYAYWQIPNSLADSPKNIDILIKRDENGKKKQFDASKTRIILKIETDDLGEITIMIDVEEKKIWYIFNTDDDAIKEFVNKNSILLKERMGLLNWEVQGVQAVKRKIDMKKYIVPTINVDSLKRVSAEV